ncbi:hypothetical protein EG68_06788 [Paragonimus skrjabini miyazakii]|uniref:GPI transamidase component PIG-S n=1 Tax=Paragonimus skrjabini miyazakii TaxID=59628 RepID=A0A8S9YSG2_9TREM|nr:hypothetical protein EG68_06788 [Paragonimus skrjabini miyazakii]
MEHRMMAITDLDRTPRITSQISSTSAECERCNVKEELARFQPTAADKNRVFYVSVFYLAVALFIGIPMWLKTTATYQAPLPFWEIKALCSRPIEIRIPVNIVSLSQKLTLSELGTIQSSLMNSEDQSLRCGSGKLSDRLRIFLGGDAATDFGTLLNELESMLFGFSSRKSAATTCSSRDEGFCTESASTYRAVLLPHTIYDRFKLSPDAEATIQRSAAHNLLYLIEPRLDGHTNATRRLTSQIAKLMNSVFVPITDLEHLTTPAEPTLTEPGQRSSTRPRTSSQLLHLLSRQLPASSAYDITITLLTHSGEATRLSSQSGDDWTYRVLSDPTAWLQTHVERVFRSWMPYVRFNFYSQRLYAVDIEQLGPSRLNENHTYRYYTRDDLSTVVNQLESYLGAPQTASAATRDMAGTKPGLHLILLLAMPTVVATNHSEVPSVVECPRPLRFYLPSSDGSLVLTNVAVVPQWGGLFSIDAPTPCSKSSDVAAITGRQLVTVIRSLAGLPEPVKLSTHRLNPPAPLIDRLGEVDHWELDGWFLKRTVESLLAVRMTMTALVDLLSRFPNMVINDHVATEVARSGRVWARALDDLRQMDNRNHSIDLGEIFTHTQDSLESINSAFFDHSLLGRLYFQDDQKYGIYVPLFVPVGVGLLMSTKNAFRIMFPRESSA